MPNQFQCVRQTAAILMACGLIASLLPGFAAAQDPSTREKRAAWIVPLDGPVLAGKPVTFRLKGNPNNPHWELGDGATADGQSVSHTFEKPGVYRVGMGSKVGDTLNELSSAIVRVHTPETLHLPQIFLDTDARNEVDDQHYIGYGLFSNLDVLGINSIHHGPHRINHFGAAQEPINYGEILYIIELSRNSGLLKHRSENQMPQVFHGARLPLQVPASGNWTDTQPVNSEASEAILAAARGASPDNPVWVLPVGPCSNIASAILQAREEGLDLKSRIKIIWLGGGPEQVNVKSFNGSNDPWSVYVTGQSGVEFWIILENPTGASITMDKRVESNLYPNNPLGEYLEAITPAGRKALFDVTTISMVIGNYLGKHWLTLVEPSVVLGPDQKYRWKKVNSPANVHIIRDIDEEAMKTDFFATLNGRPTPLPPKTQRPRYMALTDITGDPDDQQSLVRLMVYLNDIEIVGILLAPFGSMSGAESATHSVISGYEQVRPNLLLHDDRYPTADYLRSVVKKHRSYPDGHGDFGQGAGVWQDHVGAGKSTEASNFLIQELEKDDPRPLWCGIWGGPVVLSQACYDIWNSGRTEARKFELLNKIRVWDVLTQDASYFYVEQYLSQYVHWCKSDTSWIGMYKIDFPGAPNSNCDLSWANANIVNNHGALGTKYPASATVPTGVKEGDTPSYTFLIPNGLNPDFVEDWGSWGGQFKRSGGQSAKSGFGNSGAGPTRWTDEENAPLAGGENWLKRLTAVARWRDDMNRDFAARMDWCVMDKSGANHNPVAAFNGDKSLNVVYLNASSGQTVQLSALGSSDPDENTISYRWTHYFEAEKSSGKGFYNNGSAISISNSTSMNASLTVPSSAAGKNIHVILEVADNGTWNMKSYRRIIIKVST